MMRTPGRIAFIHDWLNGMRGGEKVLEAVLELFPGSTIFTLHIDREKLSPFLQQQDIRISALQNMPLVKTKYRYYLPLFPAMIKRFDLSDFDLVISLSHCVAKSIPVPRNIPHISYCFTPMRYAWHLYNDYFGNSRIKNLLTNVIMRRMRKWDSATASGVDYFIAISNHIADRIRDCYQRTSDVIYPPVDTEFYTPGANTEPDDFYLVVSALVPYKRVDLTVETFNELGLPLKIIGTGPEYKKLKAMAGDNITFSGWASDQEVRDCYRRCRAFIFPGQEDFGITPLEVQACGRPVIAYKKGGAIETVIDQVSGLFFDEQTTESLAGAIQRSREMTFDPQALREQSLRFSRDRFKEEFRRYIFTKFNEFHGLWRETPNQQS